jgi:hypothetical protein
LTHFQTPTHWRRLPTNRTWRVFMLYITCHSVTWSFQMNSAVQTAQITYESDSGLTSTKLALHTNHTNSVGNVVTSHWGGLGEVRAFVEEILPIWTNSGAWSTADMLLRDAENAVRAVWGVQIRYKTQNLGTVTGWRSQKCHAKQALLSLLFICTNKCTYTHTHTYTPICLYNIILHYKRSYMFRCFCSTFRGLWYYLLKLQNFTVIT